MRVVVGALRAKRMWRVILDIESTLMESGVRIAERTSEGFRGFNPLLGTLRAGWMSLAAFSVFRPGNVAPQSHKLSLVRKIHRSPRKDFPGIELLVHSDSAGYNHRLMRYCDQNATGFVIASRKAEAIFQIIQGIEHWERLRGGQANEEAGEGIPFFSVEKEGAVYRLVVVRKRNKQRALFPESSTALAFTSPTPTSRLIRWSASTASGAKLRMSSGSSRKGMPSTISSQNISWPMPCSFNSRFWAPTWLRSSNMRIWTARGGGCESNSCASDWSISLAWSCGTPAGPFFAFPSITAMWIRFVASTRSFRSRSWNCDYNGRSQP